MFCLMNNIYICSLHDLNMLNLSSVTYIINCDKKLNNYITNKNYLNLDVDSFNNNNYIKIKEAVEFIYKHHQSSKIIILDETGIDNAMRLCIFLLMKIYKMDYLSIYNILANLTKLNTLNNYYDLALVPYSINDPYININSMVMLRPKIN